MRERERVRKCYIYRVIFIYVESDIDGCHHFPPISSEICDRINGRLGCDPAIRKVKFRFPAKTYKRGNLFATCNPFFIIKG